MRLLDLFLFAMRGLDVAGYCWGIPAIHPGGRKLVGGESIGSQFYVYLQSSKTT